VPGGATTLITGGTGLIGAALAAQLLARDERVVLFDASPAGARLDALARHGDRVTLVRGDVQSLAELADAMRAHRPRAVVHLAFVLGGEGNRAPERATRINILGTVNALEAARLTGVPRVLIASSIAVYGSDDQYPPDALPITEDAPAWVCRSLPIYGGGKLHGEHLALTYAQHHGLVTGGLRPSVVYGWGRASGSSAFLGAIIDKPAVGEPASVPFGDAAISFVHVDDVAGQFAALLEADPAVFARRRFFNTGGDTATVRELAGVVQRVIPGARIDVRSKGERDFGGLVTRVSDRALQEAVGYRRRLSPIEVGVRAQIDVARAMAGLPALAAAG
jgi:dihydroflavonol-4-reductase/UDP-glucose 4-epimerase